MSTLLTQLANRPWLQALLLLIIGLALYTQTLSFEYVWDDSLIFVDRDNLLNDPLSWKLLTEPFLEGVSYVRPLVVFSWWLEFKLFGQNPAVSHGINVLIYLVNVFLVYALAHRLISKTSIETHRLWPLALSAIYAIHPALVETTAWVSGRFDLLCTMGVLAAGIAFLSFDEQPIKKAFTVTLFTAVALLSKELGVMTPFILACLWMATYSDQNMSFFANVKNALSSNKTLWIFMAMAMIFYFIARASSHSESYTDQSMAEHLSYALPILLPVESLKYYTLQVLWPFGNISTFHPIYKISHSPVAISLTLFTLFIAALTAWKALFQNKRWAWLLIAAYAGIVLVLHLIPIRIADNIGQSRFLTLPLAFVCISLPFLPWHVFKEKLSASKPLIKALVFKAVPAMWFLGLLLASLQSIPYWKSPLTLWQWQYVLHSDLEMVRYNYLESTLSNERFDLTEKHFAPKIEKEIGLDVSEQIIYVNFLLRTADPEAIPYGEGIVYALPPLHELPEKQKKEALKVIPLTSQQIFSVYSNLAHSYLLFRSDFDKAEKYANISRSYVREGTEIFPDYFDAILLFLKKDHAGAEGILKKYGSGTYASKNSLDQQLRSIIRIYCEGHNGNPGNPSENCDQLKVKLGF